MRKVEFQSGDRETVRGVLDEPSEPGLHPGIILVHGLLSARQELGDYATKFCERGYVVLAIDLRGHGESDGLRGFVTEDRSVEDVRRAMDFLTALPNVDPKRIVLMGHSLGGAAVICAAARDPRPKAIVAGATVGRLRDEITKGEYIQYRVADILNRMQKAVTGKSMYIRYPISYKDIFVDPEARKAAEAQGFLQRTFPLDNVPPLLKQDAGACARELRVPALIVRGELDAAVKGTSTRRVYEAIPGEKEWYEIKGSGHSFPTDCKGKEAFEKIAAWLDHYIEKQS